MLLNPTQRQKLDGGNDREFYDVPRFVTHVDTGFIDRLTSLYRERLAPNTRIFDMMSSWVSHLPDEMKFAYVQGHGLNEQELAKNPRFDSYFVQNLNQDLKFSLEDESFDAVLNTVSVQYLQYPEAIWLSSSYGDKQDLLKGGKGERVRGKGVLMRRSIAV